jgi:hypothetical protein
MDIEDRASVQDGDSSLSVKTVPYVLVGGGSDGAGSLSTLASGAEGSGMSPTPSLVWRAF